MNQKSVGVRGKPLNKQSEVNVLDKEAKEMEKNLKNLQARMQQQSIEDEAVPKFGGSRWKSARPDKGTVKSYTKDSQDKHRKKASGEYPVQKSQSVPQLTTQKDVCSTGFRGKDVHDWSVADVFEWLTSAQLDEYSTSFKVNEINGLLLVDITLDDLDYLGVTKLGHRKIILRSIEDLRKNGRITHHLVAANEGDRESKVSGSNAISGNVDALTAKKDTVHWSHLEPLSLNQVLDPVQFNNSTAINAADDTSDFLDEAAERAAFQEAVAGWRNSGSAVNTDHESCDTSMKTKIDKKADSGMWCNPFGSMTDELEDIADTADTKSIKSMNESKCDQESMTNYSKESDRTYAVSTEGDTSSLQGSLDEVAEHQEFVNAVNAWRSRGSKVSSETVPQGISMTMTSSKIPTGTASSSAIALAAKLSIELEDEEKQLKLIINEKKKNLEANIKQNRSINLIQSEINKESSTSIENGFDGYTVFEQFSGEAKYYPSSSEYNDNNSNNNHDNNDKILMEKETKSDDAIMSLNDSKIGESKVPQETPYKGHVAVSLKGSFLGPPDPLTQLKDEAAYTVDEGSDEES